MTGPHDPPITPDGNSLGDEAVAAFIAASPIAKWLNMSFATNDGERLYSLGFAEEHIGNPMIRALHGGVISAFLEFAMQAQLAAEGAARPISTVNVAIDFLRSSKAQDMTCTVEIDRLGRRLAFVSAKGWQGDRESPVALAQGCFRLG